MWVRTQDKEFLMKVDNINLGIVVDTKEPNRLFTFVDGVTTSFTLGKYKSKERAIEVLDEIQKAIIENKVCELYAMMSNMTIFNKNKMKFTPVYEMPKE